MNIFLENLPTALTVGGQNYPIDADYRVGILAEEILSSQELTPVEKVTSVIRNYFGKGSRIPKGLTDIDEAFEKALWFYRCGEEPLKYQADGRELLYSFSFDAGRIYASFLQQYGADILSVPFLHWWKFLYLLKGLGPDTPFARCADIRARKFRPDMSPEERKNLADLKALYSMPETDMDKERMSAIYDALENGGNISELLNDGQR